MQKFVEFLVKFKDILTTIIGFVPLVVVLVDEINKWLAGGSNNIMNLLLALAVAAIGWFTGKGKLAAK